jgi:dihydrodipicolinate synthase/N-acetylneuraminate lyase
MQDLATRLYNAIVLPFTTDDKIDEAAYRKLVRYFLQDRYIEVGGIIANPEAGEIYYLEPDEKRRVLDITLEEVAGRMPVFCGVFELTTSACIRAAREAKAAGASGLFLMPPAGSADLVVSWNAEKYPEYWLDQIKEIDAAVNLPIICHPVSSPSPQWGIGLPGSATKLICESVPNVIGWKMTYNYEGMRKIWSVLRALDRPVSIMAAGGRFFHEFLAYDMLDGSTSGSFNYALEPMLDHIEAWQRNDVVAARKIWLEGGLDALHHYIYADYARLHLRYKIAAWLRGLIPSPRMRSPMPKPKAEEIETIYGLLKGAGIAVIDRKDVTDGR